MVVFLSMEEEKREEANVEFYKSSETTDTSSEILIDVRLNKIGTPRNNRNDKR